MRLLRNILLFFIINSVFSTVIYAQNNYIQGYVLTNENDTIFGLINFRTIKNNHKQCSFKADEYSEVITLLSKQKIITLFF